MFRLGAAPPYFGAAPPILGESVSSYWSCFMASIEVQGAVVVATMRDVAGRVYEADAPVLDGRGGLPSPLGRLASYLYRLAILIRPDDFLSVSCCSQPYQQSASFFFSLKRPKKEADLRTTQGQLWFSVNSKYNTYF